ncbi:MAG TPA: ABC transporter substrate-binding protein [Rhizomicrobium sp.]|jgi:NitT/TauT family transport system substrate-binding protein|nr:ABC transporter substrate-binding protein [Rhizomicrobium sp.]
MKYILAAMAALLFATSAQAAPLTKVRFVTDWKAQAEHGGFYEALAKGYYAKEGLDVRIIEGGPSVNVPQMLAGGAADFGIGSNGFISLNMVREGVPIRAVMAVFQKDPQVLITHPRADIRNIAQMKGKPIMISDASTAAFWPWLKAKYGFQDSQIRKYTFNLAPFMVDQSAIQEGYLTSEPYTIEREGHFKPQVFLLADAGYPGYANMVLATQTWIDGQPKVVQAFVDASVRGWTDYLYGDPKPANALIKRDNRQMTDDVIAQSIAKMKSYGLIGAGDDKLFGLGIMTDARWKLFFSTMASEGLYPRTLDYRKAYDPRFARTAPKYFESFSAH